VQINTSVVCESKINLTFQIYSLGYIKTLR